MVIPEHIRAEIVAHAIGDKPNEACGLVGLRDGVAKRYVRATNRSPSPHYFELDASPDVWMDLHDDGYEVAIFHSHLSSPPRPSRTDVENIGLWEGEPYLIYTLSSDTFGAWRIVDGRVNEEELEATSP